MYQTQRSGRATGVGVVHWPSSQVSASFAKLTALLSTWLLSASNRLLLLFTILLIMHRSPSSQKTILLDKTGKVLLFESHKHAIIFNIQQS